MQISAILRATPRVVFREVRRLLRVLFGLTLLLVGTLLLVLPGAGLETLGLARAILVDALPFLPRLAYQVRRVWEVIAPKPDLGPPPPLRRTDRR